MKKIYFEDRPVSTKGQKNYPIICWADHPLAYGDGTVYVHHAVCYKKYGRGPNEKEHIHHIDDNIWNWKENNIVLIKKWVHMVVHAYNEGRISENKYICKRCKKYMMGTNLNHHTKYCVECRDTRIRGKETSKDWPTVNDLISKVKQSSFRAAAKELEISANGIRKRLRKFGIDPKSVRSIKDNRFK